MARATERPFGVSFAAGWAAIAGALALLRAMGLGLVGAVAPSAAGTLVGLALAVVQFVLGFGLLAVAGGLFRVQGWARLGGLVLFGLFALLNLYSLVTGDVAAVVGLGLHGTALALLALDGDAFGTDRPDHGDADSGGANRFGRV